MTVVTDEPRAPVDPSGAATPRTGSPAVGAFTNGNHEGAARVAAAARHDPAGAQGPDLPETVGLLSRVNLFAGLPELYLRRIEALGQVESHPSGAMIFEEATPGDKVYLILAGRVRISRTIPGLGEEALAI